MIASGVWYWTIVGLAAAVYAGMNVWFLRAILPRRRPGFPRLARIAVGHGLPQAAVLAGVMLLTQLVVAPLLLLSTVLLLTLLANNKKYASLNEPLLPADVAMALRQLHAWRLLGQYARRDVSVMVALPTSLAATVAVFLWEPWLLGPYFFSLALLSPIPALVFWPPRGEPPIIRAFNVLRIPFCDWDLCASVAAAGFFPTFLRSMNNIPQPAVRTMTADVAEAVLDKKLVHGDVHLPAVMANSPVPLGTKTGTTLDKTRREQMPHIVAVLAEGFVDPRAMNIFVEPDPLTGFGEAIRRSAYSGRAWVPVYGGWTIRSEYSLLTGINLASFANNIGNPNSTLVNPATHSLPKHLKSLGYRTALVHPHDARFYGRNRAAVSLGFDDFLDERSFEGAPREGRYISDLAVAARIEEELRRATAPSFLFCITMENHGPWDDKTPPIMAPFTVRPELSPASHLCFSHYLRHLRSADLMIRRLTGIVATAERPTIVLLVGDHLPALTNLFYEVGAAIFPEGAGWSATAPYLQTPYFLLSSTPAEHREMNCDISFLPGLLLDCAGLNSDRFFGHNSAMRRHQNGNIHDRSDSVVRDAYLRFCYEVATFPERYARAA
jgi:hypothetical protein